MDTFLMLDGIGDKKQEMLYEIGIKSWNDFLCKKDIKGISKKAKILYDLKIKKLSEAIQKKDLETIKKLLPKREYWRLYPLMRDKTLFLDIETSEYYGDVTVIGMYSLDMNEPFVMVANYNLNSEDFFRIISKHDIIVTFNGSSFDIPIVERFFGKKIDKIHIDLRHLCARIGLNAGLKVIEKILDIQRKNNIDDPIFLWEAWQATKREEYLCKLIEYNKEDVINMVPILEYCVKQLSSA